MLTRSSLNDRVSPSHRVQASLGLSFHRHGDAIPFDGPVMLEFLDELHLVDALLPRHEGEVAITITSREGKVPIAVFL